MSEFNLIWRRYNLKDNPYFNAPLTIGNEIIPLSSFVGRKKEVEQLKKIISLGSDVRNLIVGDAGVGKTSLVNYIRWLASEGQFFTTLNEIELNRAMSANEFIIITLSAIYSEIKRRNITLSDERMEALENLYSLTQITEQKENFNKISYLNYTKLSDLFREVIKEIVHPRFKGIILHYDNLDNIKNLEAIYHLIGDIRDILLTPKIIFFFVGDKILRQIVLGKDRVRQIFLSPLEIESLSFSDIKKILDERIEQLKINDNVIPIHPHTEKTLKTLFDLHNGNLRDILSSLSNCILEIPPSNTAIIIDDDILREKLYARVERLYLSKLTEVEKGILLSMVGLPTITPTDLAKITKKTPQNISSKYLPKFADMGAVEFKGREGRNSFYRVAPEILWYKLRKEEKNKSEERTEKKIRDIELKLSKFM